MDASTAIRRPIMTPFTRGYKSLMPLERIVKNSPAPIPKAINLRLILSFRRCSSLKVIVGCGTIKIRKMFDCQCFTAKNYLRKMPSRQIFSINNNLEENLWNRKMNMLNLIRTLLFLGI
jgi:hypothetical protein